MESLYCGMIEDLPEGRPLEKRRTPKKTRVLPSKRRPTDLYCGMIEDIPEGRPLEKRRTPKKTRVLPSKQRPTKCDMSLWSSIDAIITEPTHRDPTAEIIHEEATEPAIDSPPLCSTPPPPVIFIECGTSTPRAQPTNRENTFRARTKRSARAPKKGQECGPKSKRCIIPSDPSPSTSRKQSQQALKDNKMSYYYGSEEDSNDGAVEMDDIVLPTGLVPRGGRIFVEEDEEEMHPVDAELSFQWPPRRRSLLAPISPASTLHPEPTSEPEPTSNPTSEPDSTSGQEPIVITLEFQLPPNPEFAPEADPIVHEPISKFDFKWKAFPESQIPPELRREPFYDINCGPTVSLASAYEAFVAIWDREIMEHIVVETNRYAQQLALEMLEEGTIRPKSRITKWRDTDVDEMYVYFAIILATGIVKKSCIEEYWNAGQDIFVTPGFTVTMPYDRFQLLSKCLHFQNNDDCNPEVLTRSQAKLFKVQPILDHLNNKFSQLYNMSQNIALDESLTMWKGWLDINQFIRNKAASIGVKTYEVCESQTGYLWRFEVHAGHTNSTDSSEESPVSGFVPSLVLKLLHGLEHKGHTIWMDNYYNSPALARELKVLGFDCVGTLRTNRQFVPVELANLNKNDMAIGQVSGCTSGDVDLLVWRDKNRVALISTYHGLASVKCGDTLMPTVVSDYNLCMGGVDRKDQMLATYPIERRRNRIWYKKLFKRLLNASVLNAFILLRTQEPTYHRSFRKTLVRQLLSKHAPQPSGVVQPSVGHFPGQYNFLAGKQHERQRRFCVVCKKRTTAYCKACNVPLCIFTCFEPHHTSGTSSKGKLKITK